MTRANGNPHTIEVDLTDLYKVADTLKTSLAFFRSRDEMNASVHLASNVRYSPLTSAVESSLNRLNAILNAQENTNG